MGKTTGATFGMDIDMDRVKDGYRFVSTHPKIKSFTRDNSVLFTHTDLDGHMAAMVIDAVIPEIPTFCNNYGNKRVWTIDQIYGKNVIFTDYSLNAKDFNDLLSGEYGILSLTVFDHHETTLKNIKLQNGDKNHIPYYIDITTEYCGAKIAFENCKVKDLIKDLFSEEQAKRAAKLINYVDDYDCWKKQYIESDYINAYVYGSGMMYPRSPIYTSMLYADDGLEKAIKYGKKFYDNKMELYRTQEDAFAFEVEDFKGLHIKAIQGYGNSLMFPDIYDYDAVCIFHQDNRTQDWKYSLFTEKDEIDILSIAESFGGGGHAHACGFTTYENLFKHEQYKAIVGENY